MKQRARRRYLPSLSTLLILVGVALMLVGTYTAFQYRPRPLTAAEQAALEEGEVRAAASVAPALLPAPGAADLSEKGEITSLDDAASASAAPSEPVAPAPAPALPGGDDEPVVVRRPAAPPTSTPPKPTPLPVATSIPAIHAPDRIAASVELETTVRAEDGRVVFENREQRSSTDLQGKSGGYGYAVRFPLTEFAPGLYVIRVQGRTLAGGADSPVAKDVLIRVR